MPSDTLGCTFVRVVAQHSVELSRCHGIVASLNQGIAPWNAALTDSDIVTVGDAPVTVKRVMLLRPIMCDALVSRCLIHKVDDNLATNTHDGSSNEHAGCNTLSHDCVE